MSYADLAAAVNELNVSSETLTQAVLDTQEQAIPMLTEAIALVGGVGSELSKKANDLDLLNATDATKGPAKVRFTKGVNYPAGSLGARLNMHLSVTDAPFNALPSPASATSAFQAAYDAAAEGGTIIIPGPGPYLVGALIGTKKVTWEALYDLTNNTTLLALPGTVQCRLGAAVVIYRTNAAGTDFASLRSTRLASYAGGTVGNVCSNVYARTAVSNALADSFEWVGTFIMDNSGPGQNCAVYGQANRRALSAITRGGTFGGVFESRDFTLEANPTSGLIGIEVDIFANGGDSVGRRIGMDMVIGKGVAEGDPCEVYAGLRFGPTNGITANARFRNAILINGAKDYGMQVLGTGVETSVNILATGGKIGVNVGGSNTDADYVSAGTSVYGLRLSGTYSSGIGIRMAANVAVAFESTGAIKLRYDNLAWRFSNGATEKVAISTATGAISVAGKQVVGLRDTGWAPMTGTSNKGTVYDTATVTLAQLAGRVAALQASITNNQGLIGV